MKVKREISPRRSVCLIQPLIEHFHAVPSRIHDPVGVDRPREQLICRFLNMSGNESTYLI